MLIFIISFLQVSLVSINTRNVAQSRYALSFLTSLAITFFWALNIKLLTEAHFSWPSIVATGLGGALGVVAGTLLHKRFTRRKPVREW